MGNVPPCDRGRDRVQVPQRATERRRIGGHRDEQRVDVAQDALGPTRTTSAPSATGASITTWSNAASSGPSSFAVFACGEREQSGLAVDGSATPRRRADRCT